MHSKYDRQYSTLYWAGRESKKLNYESKKISAGLSNRKKENAETTLLWSVRDKSKLYTSNTETALLWSIPG